jgi:hypothetical protein
MMRGVANAFLMVTLVRPIVRLAVSRWRRRAREAAPAVISGPMQELFEAALVEELSPPVVELEPMAEIEPAEDLEALAEEVAEVAGRSTLRTLVIAGGLVAVIAISVMTARALVQRRRAARADRELVAVPVETEAAGAIEEAEAIATSAE